MADPSRLLILGGTREALELARRASAEPRFHVITSLAGRTRAPTAIPGELRVGGFGGAEGLVRYLREAAIDLVIDATHPFAASMAGNAAVACAAAEVPRVKLLRPPWGAVEGDRWVEVPDSAAAAGALQGLGKRAFLTTGHRDLAAFAGLEDTWFLVRLIEPPEEPVPLTQHQILLARGPFAEDDEIALLNEHRIEAVVTKNSGGPLTYAKIAAARHRGLPVVMIGRPAPPAGELVDDVTAAHAWIGNALS